MLAWAHKCTIDLYVELWTGTAKENKRSHAGVYRHGQFLVCVCVYLYVHLYAYTSRGWADVLFNYDLHQVLTLNLPLWHKYGKKNAKAVHLSFTSHALDATKCL